VGTPDSAAESIHQAADAFISSDNSLADLLSTLLSNLPDLCRDRPLNGDHLGLFQAIERWEAAVGDDRDVAEYDVKAVAVRLAAAWPRSLGLLQPPLEVTAPWGHPIVVPP
jgi:hypothetical protein